MPTFELRLSLPTPHPQFAFKTRGLLDALDDWLKKHEGGYCSAAVTDSLAIAQVCAPSRDVLQDMMESYAGKRSRDTPGLKITIAESSAPPLAPDLRARAESLNTNPVRLTRKFFNQTAAGAYLASNIYHQGREAFADTVATTAAEREIQWTAIVASGASQRMCRIFPSKAAYLKWRDGMVRYFASQPSN